MVGTGDFNGDGKTDILWRNSLTGTVYENLMNGTTVIGSGFLGGDNTLWSVVGTGDFNGDGKTDILWRNSQSGQVYENLMNGTTVIGGGGLGGDNTYWKPLTV